MREDFTELQNRIRDLANRSYKQDMYTFTGFLSLPEIDAFYQIERELSFSAPKIYGGYENSERAVLRFGDEAVLGYEQEFPIICIHIRPLMEKFAESLSHRDFLGALMNLGIERSVFGDIKAGDKDAYLFCLESMGEYICDNLDKVRHTHVKCEIVNDFSDLPEEKASEVVIQVSSARADAVISKVFNLSRNDSLELFRAGRVFIGGRLCENNSKEVKARDAITVRGFGKFIIDGEWGSTKKGKLSGKILLFK